MCARVCACGAHVRERLCVYVRVCVCAVCECAGVCARWWNAICWDPRADRYRGWWGFRYQGCWGFDLCAETWNHVGL